MDQLNKYVWEYANFSAGKSIDMPDPKVCSQWDKRHKLDVSASGLLIRDLIIKTCQTVRLRSLGAKMHIRGRLVGGSSLWLFTRVTGSTGQMEERKPICVIKKEVDSQRVFVIFGILTDVSKLEKPNLMKTMKGPVSFSQEAKFKEPVFSAQPMIDGLSNEGVIDLQESDDGQAHTDSDTKSEATPSNFYFFANQEIPAFHYDMMDNKF